MISSLPCSSLQNGVAEREGGSPLTSVDEVMEDAGSPQVRATQEVVELELGDFGSTLAERQHELNHLDGMRSVLKTNEHGADDSSAVLRDTTSSEERTVDPTLSPGEETKKKKKKKKGGWWSVGSGGDRGAGGGKTGRNASGEHSGVSLAHLARPVPSSSQGGFPMSSFNQETNIERIRGSSESSLSSCEFTKCCCTRILVHMYLPGHCCKNRQVVDHSFCSVLDERP